MQQRTNAVDAEGMRASKAGMWCSKQYTIQNAHKLNDIKLDDVDSILDCDRLDIFYNLYSLVYAEKIKLII